MKQHFLLSAKARTLSVVEIARMSDDEAYAAFKAVRFADSGGEPVCPKCACPAYEFRGVRRLFKCKGCEKQFTITSGTIFRSHKMSFQDILTAIALFVNGVNGHAALRLSRDLNCSYKAAFVLAHKLRKVMEAIQTEHSLTGTVEIDGVYIGGYIRQPNMKIARTKDGRDHNEKRRSIVTMRERRVGGRSRSVVVKSENESLPSVLKTVHPSADVVTDLGSAWGKLYLAFNDHQTVNHTQGHVIHGIHINPLEAQHLRIRRGERGVYMQISGAHAERYAHEFSWRDDQRRVSNGQQYRSLLARATRTSPDLELAGYWQKRPKAVRRLLQARRLKLLTRRKRESRKKREAANASAGPTTA